MKKTLNSAVRCNGTSLASSIQVQSAPWLLALIFAIGLCMSGCQKHVEGVASTDEIQSVNSHTTAPGDAVFAYNGLSPATVWELQQARAATAKYQNIDNALKDGYADIEVDVQHMGHHFMKAAIVDSIFDLRQPEILVYNKNDKGVQQLVAVEYAVPLTYPMPEGFTGSADVWNGTSGFPLWLLHAWVWAYNPDGVFNWTNPAVELN